MVSTTELANALYEKNRNDFKSKAAAERAVKGTLELISGALENGDDVRLHGFGSFTVKTRAARKGTNLQTGEKIDVPAKNVVRFKAATALGNKVQ